MNGNESRMDTPGYKMKTIGIIGNKTVEVKNLNTWDKIQSNIVCSESKRESVPWKIVSKNSSRAQHGGWSDEIHEKEGRFVGNRLIGPSICLRVSEERGEKPVEKRYPKK